MREKSKSIRDYILQLAKENTPALATKAAEHFHMSVQAIIRHVKKAEQEGLITTTGGGRLKKYALANIEVLKWEFDREGLREDAVWREKIQPLLDGLPENVRDTWHYGVTEMVNNAVDHSEGKTVSVYFERTALDITIWIADDGEGIFHRVQRLLGLYDPRESILELAKGKLTTDPANHSGEGIFFTSRVFDHFAILSRNLYFSHEAEKRDWLIQYESDRPGTTIKLTLANNTTKTLNEVMDFYAAPDEFTFSKTTVPVRLATHEGEKLVSRSQAKRLVARFEKFKTVILDFDAVEEIGQAFADEIFRVFANNHPETELIPLHTTKEVKQMISRAINREA